jgi:hypothetical protein
MKYYLTALIYLFTQLYNTYVYGSNGKLSSYRKGNRDVRQLQLFLLLFLLLHDLMYHILLKQSIFGRRGFAAQVYKSDTNTKSWNISKGHQKSYIGQTMHRKKEKRTKDKIARFTRDTRRATFVQNPV